MNLIEAYHAAKTKEKMIRRKSWGKTFDKYEFVGFDGSFYYCAGVPNLGTVKCDFNITKNDMLDDWEVIQAKEIYDIYDQYVAERNKAIEKDRTSNGHQYTYNCGNYYILGDIKRPFVYLNNYPNKKPII